MSVLLAERVRAPWWQWLLLSLGSTVLLLLWTAGGLWLLLASGLEPWDLLDYFVLSRPPWITEGRVAVGFALLIAGQAVAPVLVMLLFRPARAVAFAGLRRPADSRGMWRRLLGGVVLLVVLQAVWSAVGPAPAEHWRLLDHLVYATVRGGRFWPLFWLILTAGIIAPLGEEILFRGFLFGLLRRHLVAWAAAVVSGLLFGLAHGLATALPVVIMGIYLAYQAERDRSLIGAMLLHVLNNLAAVAMMISHLTE